MLNITEVLLSNDPRLSEMYKDLLVLGVALHDVGKVIEMKDGVYQPNSFVSHRTFGAEFLMENKHAIVLNSSLNFYYQLLAVMQGHHGEFEEPAKTVVTQIVHLIDMLESGVTGLMDRIAADNLSEDASGEKCVTFPQKLYI
jgi:3'-5' exoribonuclease